MRVVIKPHWGSKDIPKGRVCNVFFCGLQFCWHSAEVDRDMEFVMTVIKTIRSLRADYNLTKTRADCEMTNGRFDGTVPLK